MDEADSRLANCRIISVGRTVFVWCVDNFMGLLTDPSAG